jgi:hypothetical protein
VHKLKVHHIRFEVGHGIGKFSKGWLKRIQRKWRIVFSSTSRGLAKG